MKYIYTAIFTRSENTKKVYARVPDLPGCITTGHDLQDAIDQITDAAAGWLVVAEDEGISIPAATPQSELKLDNPDELSMIRIDTIAYRTLTDTRAVRKNVSLPAWMANLADKQGLNCSQILQDGLRRKFGLQ